MGAAEIRVLHVLPHPGGGGETYVRTLARLEGVACDRVFVAPSDRVSSAILPAVATAIRIRRRTSGYDLLHAHGEVAAGLCLPVIARCPSVVTLHGLNAVRRFRGLRGRVARANLRAVVGRADRTICVSQAELDEVRALDPQLAHACVVIPNGVDVPPPSAEERRAARAALGVAEESVLVLWVGALREPKQPQAAVRAVLEVARDGDPLQLAVLGDGPLRPAAEQAATASPAAVRFFGQQADVRPFLAAADVFVLVSAREGLPFALLEAMAAGLVPVVAAGPGVEEAVGDGGIAVAQGDGRGLAAALRALARDSELRSRLAAGARARAAERFSMAAMLDRTRLLYDDVLAREGSPP